MPLLMCPNCDASMQAVQRATVEFDMCPQCRGVWLDRGELEKLMAMERGEPRVAQPRLPDYDRPREPRDDRRDDDRRYDQGGQSKKKRFDLFDIFD
ncbi:zf-TFIIB domain-containing protein [Caulobacter sp. DWR2-3-1b2]|uniref:TFIIB-type zinc ribbon-containing protein n=1 Tax=unclassified Caulobacter TaxID=2648921 RepID=UPI0019BF0F52|nr:zf-TFIIB domain-containing protein [Caulobacter sp.]